MDSVPADAIVDARGRLCPMPIVLLSRRMRELPAGSVLKLLATDRGARADVPAWADDTGHELVSTGEEDGALVFVLRKPSA